MILVEIVVVALVSYRLWRLLAVDKITEPVRDRMSERVLDPWQCPWCLGWWCTVAVGLVAWWVGLVVGSPWLVIPAAAVLVGFIGEHS